MRFVISKVLLVLLCVALPFGSANAETKVGEPIPHHFKLQDHNGNKVEFDGLKGEKGLVVFFVRSADWCPFCKIQMEEFSSRYKDFKKFGYEVVSVSYDSIETLARFGHQHGIAYRMLSDTGSESIKAFGLLNDKYKRGSRYYGIPHPAVYVINAEGVVTHMFSESGYKSRPPIDGILAALER
ncbi:MAG: peroxiredoxin family protein [Alphaproteobacteria bacterium]